MSKKNATHDNENHSKAKNDYKDRESFAKLNARQAAARNTVFSLYSKGIEDALGDTGVICMPTQSEILKTDYDTYKQPNDIPIIASSKKVAQPMKGIIVKNHVVKEVSVQTSTTKVVKTVSDVKVSEINNVRAVLRAKGIDASKIMFLGSKSSTVSELEKLVKSSRNRSNVSVKEKASFSGSNGTASNF